MNEFEKFTVSLYQESPRGAFELESMKYGIMARIGLKEPDALELAVKIVAANKPINKENKPMADDELRNLIDSMSFEEFEEAIRQYKTPKQEAAQQATGEAAQLDLDEQNQLADLQRNVRGPNYATAKYKILSDFARRRKALAEQPALDPEIEKAKKDNSLGTLYAQRRKAIESRRDIPTATKLHLNSELESEFRRAGLK